MADHSGKKVAGRGKVEESGEKADERRSGRLLKKMQEQKAEISASKKAVVMEVVEKKDEEEENSSVSREENDENEETELDGFDWEDELEKFDEAPSESMDPIELSDVAKNLKALMRRAFLRFEGELSSLKAENLKRKEEFENLSYLNEQLSKELDEVRKSSEESLKAMDDDLATVVEEIMEVRQSLVNGEHPLVESESSIPRKLDPFFTEPWLEAKKAEVEMLKLLGCANGVLPVAKEVEFNNQFAYLATEGPNFAADVVRGVAPTKANEAELFQLCWRIAHRAITRAIPSGMLNILIQNYAPGLMDQMPSEIRQRNEGLKVFIAYLVEQRAYWQRSQAYGETPAQWIERSIREFSHLPDSERIDMIISGFYASPFKAYLLVNRNKFRGSVKDFNVDKDILERQWQEMPTAQKFAWLLTNFGKYPKTHERLCAKLVSKLKKEERFERMKLDSSSPGISPTPKPAVESKVESSSSFLPGAKGRK